MNQKMDLPLLALNLEKSLALVATHLNVESVELVLIATGKHNSSFWLVAPHKHFALQLAPRDSIGLLFYERRYA
ncbi:hypothetical protein [uncultured Nostoc sp.]|uniref:hypothetical protein n=1 Tax=uncultured Nostoc sp. TaxID=340711 RepID=UPI00262E0691|nr:hypothetical protein [uncultured Nostoc sp.]